MGNQGQVSEEVRSGLGHRPEETAWAKARRGERRGGFVELGEVWTLRTQGDTARPAFGRACSAVLKTSRCCRQEVPPRISQARSGDRPNCTKVERGRWDDTGRPKAGLVERVGKKKELSQGVEAEGLVRWSQVWLPTATHPRWKHSIQSHDRLPRNETIMMTGGNSRFWSFCGAYVISFCPQARPIMQTALFHFTALEMQVQRHEMTCCSSYKPTVSNLQLTDFPFSILPFTQACWLIALGWERWVMHDLEFAHSMV